MKRICLMVVAFFLFACTINTVYAANNLSVFVKQDDKGNVVKDAEFVEKTLNGKVIKKIKNCAYAEPSSNTYTTLEDCDDGVYPFLRIIDDSDLIYNIITSEQKEILNSIKTYEDFVSYNGIFSQDKMYEKRCEGKTQYIDHLKQNKGIVAFLSTTPYSNNDFLLSSNKNYKAVKMQESIIPKGIRFSMPSSIIIEETKTPLNLEKEIIVVPISVTFYYNILENGNLEYVRSRIQTPLYTKIDGDIYDTEILYKYDSNIDYNKYSDIIDKQNNSHVYLNTCGTPEVEENYGSCLEVAPLGFVQDNSPLQRVAKKENTTSLIPKIGGPFCHSVVVDKTSTEDLSQVVKIDTYVDGKQSIQTQKNSDVTITVKVNNSSRTGLHNNTVVSKVPKDLKYVDNSAIKGGIYNADSHTITWNLDYLDSNSTELFSYVVNVPTDVDEKEIFLTEASITTSSYDTPIVSDEAVVNLGNKTDNITNPKTGNFSQIILLLIALISTLSFIHLLTKKSIQEI